MKKIILWLQLIFFITAAPSFSNTMQLPEDTVLLISCESTSAERYALIQIQNCLEKLYSKKFSIKYDKEPQTSFEIQIGNTNRSTNNSQNTNMSYKIKSVKNGIAITGGGNRGVINGAFRFLEEFGGYRYFTAESGMVTEQKEILLTENINIEYTPFFDYTDTDWISPCDVNYSLANGLNGEPHRNIPEELGGTVGYISGYCHTFINQFCKPGKYFEAHPEYYALKGNKRVPEQLCLSNPEVFKVIQSEILEIINKTNINKDQKYIISLTQADNWYYCECDECSKIDQENGSHSGSNLAFANKVAQWIKSIGYDNIMIDTFAYTYTRKPPLHIIPEDNVIIRLCSIECCFAHDFTDDTCDFNKDFCTDLINWNNICKNIYIWNYSTNYAETTGPFPNFQVIQKNIQFLYEHNVKGIYDEGNYYMKRCDTEFGELRSYLISRCLQNPYCDYEKEMELFIKYFYGDKDLYLKQYLDILGKNAGKPHLGIYSTLKNSLNLSDQQIIQCDELWENAKNNCSDAVYLERIKRSELSWRIWKMVNHKTGFNHFMTYSLRRKQLYQDVMNMGVKQFQEGSSYTRYYYFTVIR